MRWNHGQCGRFDAKIDLLVIDEAHHVASAQLPKVIGRAREINPKVRHGVTATPERSRPQRSGQHLHQCGRHRHHWRVVQVGHLVPPKAMVVDIGTQEALRTLKRSAGSYDQAEVEAIQNTTIHNNQIVEH